MPNAPPSLVTNLNDIHIVDYTCGEFAGGDFGGVFHLAGKVIGDIALVDGEFVRLGYQFRRFKPIQVFEHHHAAEQQGTRVDHILVGVFRRGAVCGFKECNLVADIGARGDADTTYLGCQSVAEIVPIQVCRCDHIVFAGGAATFFGT